jgi:branched-chain amino acid transport system ATP-binding protein
MAGKETRICLELHEIGMQFQTHSVLKDVSLAIEDQEIVSIIGPNGAGKTTLFNIISGRVKPTRGTVRFHGEDITGWPAHRICRAGIARTFQNARPFPEMSVEENVRVGIRFGSEPCPRTPEGAMEMLELVGLGHKAHTSAKCLTLSELRRLEVARALATRPHLLLLDEIAAGLSPQAIGRAVELVRTLRTRGLTLLIIDHFLSLTAQVSDRLIALDHGEKIVEGKPSEVLQSSKVLSGYFGERNQESENGLAQ